MVVSIDGEGPSMNPKNYPIRNSNVGKGLQEGLRFETKCRDY